MAHSVKWLLQNHKNVEFILLPLSSKCWAYKYLPPHTTPVVFCLAGLVSCLLACLLETGSYYGTLTDLKLRTHRQPSCLYTDLDYRYRHAQLHPCFVSAVLRMKPRATGSPLPLGGTTIPHPQLPLTHWGLGLNTYTYSHIHSIALWFYMPFALQNSTPPRLQLSVSM